MRFAENGPKWGFLGKMTPKTVSYVNVHPKAITLHGTTLLEPLTTKIGQAVWAVGSLKKKRKKNLETLENAVTLDPCHDPHSMQIQPK